MAKVKYYDLKDIEFVEKSSRIKPLEGKRFKWLTVLGFAGRENKCSMWFCQCDCGNITKVHSNSFKRGKTYSCGCYSLQVDRTTHGMSKTPEYKAYYHAKERCTSEKYYLYHRYGGRGIKFLFNSFEEFFKEVGLRPSKIHSLDRKDNDGNYEKGNIKWSTHLEQNQNRSISIFIECYGESLPISAWAERTGISYDLILKRYNKGVRGAENLFKKSRITKKKGRNKKPSSC